MLRQERLAHGFSSPRETGIHLKIRNALRHHFNTRFAPLPEPSSKNLEEIKVESEPDSDSVDWDGIASDEERVETIEAPKPPNLEAPRWSSLITDGGRHVDDSAEDLTLQKLVTKTRLFDGPAVWPASGNRHRILAHQLQNLGAGQHARQAHQIPLTHRRGIEAKRCRQEAMKQQEAQRNQVISSKHNEVKRHQKHRIRSVDGPAIGKYRNGVLKIRKKEALRLKS